TQKVGQLIGDGYKGEEVKSVINTLKEYGVLMDLISEKLDTVTGEDGTEIKVDKGFVTTYRVLYDSLNVVVRRGDAYANIHQDIMHFVNSAYKHYKTIRVATTGENYIQTSEKNNLAGVVFAADNPNFGKEFVSAIAKQRFWNRT